MSDVDLLAELGTSTGESRVEERFRPSLVKRARQREVYPTGPGKWTVLGDDKLNDSFPYYTIKENGRLHHCTCQDHQGGEFRRVCSHILAVMLWKEGQEGQEEQEVQDQEPGALVPCADGLASDDPDQEEEGEETSSPSSSLNPRDPAWGYPLLPDWVREFRPHQLDAIEDVVEAFERGVKVVFLDAPTGSGKTLIAEAVRRRMGDNVPVEMSPGHEAERCLRCNKHLTDDESIERGYGPECMMYVDPARYRSVRNDIPPKYEVRYMPSKAVYTCTTKTLQDQFLEDFPYAAVLKGRDNYPTVLAPFPDVTAGDCTARGVDDDCNWCPSRTVCEYQAAKAQALDSDLAVLNTAYALTAWNGPKTFRGRGLVIIDECDLLEQSLMGFVEVRISEKKRERYRIGMPNVKTYDAKSARGDWLEWAEDTIPKLKQAFDNTDPKTSDIHEIREARWLQGILANLDVLREGLMGEHVQWVYDGNNNAVVFKPVEVSAFGEKYVWSHGQRFLLMSASIVSAEEMAASLGLEAGMWDVVKVPSTFPAENRPIHVMSAGKVTSKTYDGVIDELGRYLRAIVEHHAGERMLIHTVSYKLARDLHRYLKGIPNTRTYSNARERELILEWMRRTEGAVVLAPSFDRGVDLPGDYCTVQVVAKVPYPYLGDKQVSARMHMGYTGQVWYSVQTARTLVQMTGRGVRSDVDRCTTYIIDGQFKDFWKHNRRLFPEWWKEAVDFTGRVRSRVGV